MDMLEQFSEHESVKPSFHADIVGRCFYNHQKRAWFKVVEAVPLFTYYKEKYGYKCGQFPNAEWLAQQTISLPVAPHVTPEGVDRIAAVFKDAVRAGRS